MTSRDLAPLALLAALALAASACSSARVCDGEGLPTCVCRDNPDDLSCIDGSTPEDGDIPDAPPTDAPAEDAPPEDGGSDAGPCGPCTDPTPLCRTDDNQCVECLESNDCDDGVGVCDLDPGECVQCLVNDDCEDPTEARCDETTSTCAPCIVDDDCMGIDGLGVCDDGQCVECAPGEHDSCGDERLCHGQLRQCVDGGVNSRGACRPCVADAQCLAGFHCVAPDRFGETGFFCLPDRGAGCGRPFVSEYLEAATIDGDEVDACRHGTTSCAGFVDYRNAVTGCETTATDVPGGDGACGLMGTDDQTRCRVLSGANARCTYRCDGADDCPATKDCDVDPLDGLSLVCAF